MIGLVCFVEGGCVGIAGLVGARAGKDGALRLRVSPDELYTLPLLGLDLDALVAVIDRSGQYAVGIVLTPRAAQLMSQRVMKLWDRYFQGFEPTGHVGPLFEGLREDVRRRLCMDVSGLMIQARSLGPAGLLVAYTDVQVGGYEGAITYCVFERIAIEAAEHGLRLLLVASDEKSIGIGDMHRLAIGEVCDRRSRLRRLCGGVRSLVIVEADLSSYSIRPLMILGDLAANCVRHYFNRGDVWGGHLSRALLHSGKGGWDVKYVDEGLVERLRERLGRRGRG